MSKAQRLLMAVAVVLILAGTADAWGKKTNGVKEKAELPPPPKTAKDILMDPIDFIGRIVYTKVGGVNRILRFLTGKQISEYALILVLRISCNLLYLGTVLLGFCFLPKNVMLVIGVLTSVIGPLIALAIIGIFIAFIGIFIYAPCISMNVVCFFIFCSGPLGQTVLKKLNFDKDNDGDVDAMDIFYHICDITPPRLGGGVPKLESAEGGAQEGGMLFKLHTLLNDAAKDQKHEELLTHIKKLEMSIKEVQNKIVPDPLKGQELQNTSCPGPATEKTLEKVDGNTQPEKPQAEEVDCKTQHPKTE